MSIVVKKEMKKNIIRTFFDSNTNLTKKQEINNQKIINLLNKHGCNVIQTVMGVELFFQESYGKAAAANIFHSKIKDINENEIFVCEASSPSPTLVFEIFEALGCKKPVLVLYNEQEASNLDIAFLGNPSNLLSLESYNEQNIESKIVEFLKKAKGKIPVSRFTVRLTKEISDYLNFLKAKMQCSSKNDVVLKILEKMLVEDTEFQH